MNWLYIGLGVGTTFIITSGGAITAAITEAGSGAMPGKGALAVALIAGLVAAAKHLQAFLKPNGAAPLPPTGPQGEKP